jgi:hypothetical protein
MMGGIVMEAAIGNLACPTGRYGECYTARELLSAWTGPDIELYTSSNSSLDYQKLAAEQLQPGQAVMYRAWLAVRSAHASQYKSSPIRPSPPAKQGRTSVLVGSLKPRPLRA